ncbi:uncharacterized protein LOC125510495 isoform X2 [Triticum urartu]|uniref:uncharacterized protein LOC125510495 isoform X2 n=1 Tax=Triticum urartu TaxID=4572 RepID=UPI0020448FF5|nr:uncharacterized protein LOC125510495 isoform X2 [Triticum urartu]
MPACCAAAVSPAFSGSAARRRSLGSPADAVDGRYVGALRLPQAAPPDALHLDGSCPLPPASRRWGSAGPAPPPPRKELFLRLSGAWESAVQALLELGRGTDQMSRSDFKWSFKSLFKLSLNCVLLMPIVESFFKVFLFLVLVHASTEISKYIWAILVFFLMRILIFFISKVLEHTSSFTIHQLPLTLGSQIVLVITRCVACKVDIFRCDGIKWHVPGNCKTWLCSVTNSCTSQFPVSRSMVIPIRTLQPVLVSARGRLEKEGKREIIYINLLSSIGNPKYFMSKAPMVQLACKDLTTFMYFILRLFKTIEITSVSKAPMVQLA